MDMLIDVRILDPRLLDWGGPRYGSADAAGLDLHACLDAPILLHAQAQPALIRSGLAIGLPHRDLAGLVLPRSGLGHRDGLVLGNAVGLIDADYRSEILISAWNRRPMEAPPIRIRPGDRIAQLVLVPIMRAQIRIVDRFDLPEARGGFGSTGTSPHDRDGGGT